MDEIGELSGYIPHMILLLVFGIAFALVVYRLGDKHRGYTSLLVVIGVGATIIGIGPAIGLVNAIAIGIAFALTGIPMIAGDVYKSIRANNDRERAHRKLIETLANRGISDANEVTHEAETPRKQR